jgi:hypothetical protein
MNKRLFALPGLATLTLAFSLVPLAACAQVPVDEHGEVLGDYRAADEVAAGRPLGNEDIPLMSQAELEDLVGPIALYPDDLIAVVLPAAAYPLQIMEAARFLEELENDASLKPDPALAKPSSRNSRTSSVRFRRSAIAPMQQAISGATNTRASLTTTASSKSRRLRTTSYTCPTMSPSASSCTSRDPCTTTIRAATRFTTTLTRRRTHSITASSGA